MEAIRGVSSETFLYTIPDEACIARAPNCSFSELFARKLVSGVRHETRQNKSLTYFRTVRSSAPIDLLRIIVPTHKLVPKALTRPLY